jgi:hypothetical protein
MEQGFHLVVERLFHGFARRIVSGALSGGFRIMKIQYQFEVLKSTQDFQAISELIGWNTIYAD